jgi:hypothetical protein
MSTSEHLFAVEHRAGIGFMHVGFAEFEIVWNSLQERKHGLIGSSDAPMLLEIKEWCCRNVVGADSFR